jgi:hypothetical protein
VEIVSGGTGYQNGDSLTSIAGQLLDNGSGITQVTLSVATVGLMFEDSALKRVGWAFVESDPPPPPASVSSS